MPGTVGGVAGLVAYGDLGAVAHRSAQVVDGEGVAGGDAVVVAVVGELQRQDPEVGQVLPVDAGVRLGDHHAQPEVPGHDGGVFPRGALPVVGAGDDHVRSG